LKHSFDMKTINLLVIILGFFSISAFSQTHWNNNAKYNLDMNGAPLKNVSIKLEAPYSNPTFLTAYEYNSIRELTEINVPDSADAYPWISPDGLRLYYTSGNVNNLLMFTQRTNTNSYFDPPTLVPISLPRRPRSSWLSTDELDIYVSAEDSLYYAHRDAISLPFNTPIKIDLSGISESFISGVSLNTAQNELFIYFHLYSDLGSGVKEFSRTSPTSFTYTRTLDTPSGYAFSIGQLSKNDLVFFQGATYLDGKSLIYQMTRPTPTDSFSISTFQRTQGINDTNYYNDQPSMSDSLSWVAFVRSALDYWVADDLFIAHKGKISSVFNPDEMQIYSYAFPNPASEYINIKYKTPSISPLILSIFSHQGILIYEKEINPASGDIKIETDALKDGFFFYRLTPITNKKNGFGAGKFIISH